MELATILKFCFLLGAAYGMKGDHYSQTKLYNKLFNTGYNKYVVPRVGQAKVAISSFNEAQQTMSTHLWLRKSWVDPRLRWNQRDHNGTDMISVPSSVLWTPDIVLYNSMHEESFEYVNAALAIVHSDGRVLWIPHGSIDSWCQSDLARFPYDTQTCHLKFGSWVYDAHTVDLDFYQDLEDIDMPAIEENPEWRIVTTSAEKHTVKYPCCDDPYSDLTFSMTLSRRQEYYEYLFIVPCVLLALLIPFMLLMPGLAAAKFILGAAVLISVTVLLLMLERVVPASHAMPVVGKFFVGVMTLTTLALILAALMYTFARTCGPPSACITAFASCFGKVLCISEQAMEEEDAARKEWGPVLAVFDRIFFFLFLALVIICSVAMLHE